MPQADVRLPSSHPSVENVAGTINAMMPSGLLSASASSLQRRSPRLSRAGRASTSVSLAPNTMQTPP
jgi:hypothetical protein